MRIARSLTIVLLWLAIIASPAAAATFSQDLSGLAEKSFKRKLGAINAVALSGHARAQAVLVALSKGRLFVANPGKRLVIRTGAGQYELAATGENAGEIAKPALKKVKINNRLRRVIRQALGTMTLRAPDPSRRLARL